MLFNVYSLFTSRLICHTRTLNTRTLNTRTLNTCTLNTCTFKMCSHPVQNFYLEYAKDYPSETIDMVKECPTSVAIDHKKHAFLTKDLIKDLTSDEANVLWDFAVHFVLLDVLKIIAETHCIFLVTRDMLKSLADAPFVYGENLGSFYPSDFDSPKEFEEFLFFTSDDSQKAYFLYYRPTPFDLLELLTFLSEQKGCFMEPGLLGYFARIFPHFEYDDVLLFSECPLKQDQEFFRSIVIYNTTFMTHDSYNKIQRAAYRTLLGLTLPDDIVWKIDQNYNALRASDYEKNQELVREYMDNRHVASYECFPNWDWVLMCNNNILQNIKDDRQNRVIRRINRRIKVCREIKNSLVFSAFFHSVYVTMRCIARIVVCRNAGRNAGRNAS